MLSTYKNSVRQFGLEALILDSAVQDAKAMQDFDAESLIYSVVASDTVKQSDIRALLDAPKRKSILFLVDCQYDFIPDSTGRRRAALPVPAADTKLPYIVGLLDAIGSGKRECDLIIVTCDNHPVGHSSFAKDDSQLYKSYPVTYKDGSVVQQMMWPPHCVQGSEGVKIHSSIVKALVELQHKMGGECPPILVCPKGEGEVECYSILEDVLNRPLPLHDILASICVEGANVVLVGFALDYCVGATARTLAAMQHPTLETVIDRQGCAAVDPSK